MKKLILLIVLLLSFASVAFSYEEVEAADFIKKEMNINELTIESNKDIRCKEYFYKIEPWKDGKLATIDGLGRFSTFEITGEDKIKITPLVQFPKKKIDGRFKTFPEIDIMWSCVYMAVQFFSDIKNSRNIETVPIYTNRYKSKTPYLLDSKKKIFLIPYGNMATVENYDYLIYDFDNDKVLYNPVEKGEDFKKNYIRFNFGNGLLLCQERDKKNIRNFSDDYCIFDYYKNKCIKNKLTEVLSLEKYFNIIKINDENRLIITSSENKIYVTYNEDFSEIDTEYIVSPFFQKLKNKGMNTKFTKINQNNEWCIGNISGLRGLSGEFLYKYFFISIKKETPYYFIPVITEDYYEDSPSGEFIEHSVYGTCYIEKIEKYGKDCIRLYKMSDVQAKIEKYLLEKTKSAIDLAIK